MCIFDADCGICQSSVRLSRRLRARVSFVPSQELDFTHAPVGVTPERCRQEVVFINSTGDVFGGAAAVAQILRVSKVAPLGSLLDSAPVLPIGQVVYRWVARNRSRLPQACGVDGDWSEIQFPS
ncbi:MAG: DUF393 domain-containing protein [Candidatus Nanopelagicales bacterium]